MKKKLFKCQYPLSERSSRKIEEARLKYGVDHITMNTVGNTTIVSRIRTKNDITNDLNSIF